MTLARAWRAGRRPVPRPQHVFLCVADHFEPMCQGASLPLQAERLHRWRTEYPRSVEGLCDDRGRPPQHTFFYPIECYRPEALEPLAELTRAGYGDVEVHLHHDDDTADSLRELLEQSVHQLHDRHGLLTRDSSGQLRYGFIHGNWALDNSHPTGRWCGVNNELTVLRQTGCYADFTMPAAPHPAQTRTINSVYYAIDDPTRPKSHDRGTRVKRGDAPPPESLLLIQGPLLVYQAGRWQKPRIENGNLIPTQPPVASRIDRWLQAAVTVQNHESWHFIKLHTHGAKDGNIDLLLGPVMRRFHQQLRQRASRDEFRYYYVTAREMAQLVDQARTGHQHPNFDTLHW